MDEDIVIFRRFPDDDIIALFPCLPADNVVVPHDDGAFNVRD